MNEPATPSDPSLTARGLTSAPIDALAPSLHVLVVDDERNIRKTLRVCLESMGCKVIEAATVDAAADALAGGKIDLVLLDLKLGDASGLEVLERISPSSTRADIVVITAYATVESAVKAMKLGAIDYLPKPFTPAQIAHLVQRTGKFRQMRRDVEELRSRLAESVPEVDLETRSPKMRAVLDALERAAAFDVPVLLRGESGTGKSLLARWLHAKSTRRDAPFMVVNCPTLSEELLASELFGHVRGAFTGAVADRVGKVEAAEGGTLFLDEIGELSPSLQAKLLRFLHDKEFEPVGDHRTRRANVRVVAATNRALGDDVRAGRFREDLLYRLNTVELAVPPLRERPEDVVPLARRFVAFFSRVPSARVPVLSPAAEERLRGHDWPGNVRELRNSVERALIFARGDAIEPRDLPECIADLDSSGASLGGDFSLESIEQEHIARVVRRTKTLEEAARILGIDTSTLWRRRRRQIEPE